MNREANTTPDERLDKVARKFLERQRLAFFVSENLPPKYRLVLSGERLGAKLRVIENRCVLLNPLKCHYDDNFACPFFSRF